MAVAHESATESHTGTTGSQNEDFFDIAVPFTSNSKGLLFLSFENTANDLTSAVTIDPAGANTDVPVVTGGRAVDTATEPGDCKAWFLGSGLPTTTTTVRITRTNNSGVIWAVAITVTAGGDTEVFGVLLEQENQALTEENVDDGSPGTNSVRYAGVNSGRGAVPDAGANSTLLHDIDFGTRVASTVRETTAGQGSRPVGFVAVDDDVAAVYLAIREVAGASPQTIAVVKASETETAKTVTAAPGAVTITITQASETESAKAIAANAVISVTVGVANETETAQAVAVVIGAVSIAVGVATETESANTVGAAFLVPVGVATETESAGVVTAVPGTVTVTVGVASETETANAVAADVAQLISVGVATEIETAKTVTPTAGAVTISVGTATETETAYTVDPVAQGGPQTISVAVAIEVETAGAVTIDTTVTIAVGAVSETETAVGVIAAPGAVLVSVGVASETETAGTVTPTSGSGITAVFTGESGSETLRNTTRGIKRNSTRGIKRNTTRRITSKRD